MMLLSRRRQIVQLCTLVACSLLIAGCSLSSASGANNSPEPTATPDASITTQNPPEDLVPPLHPALPTVEPFAKRLLAEARELQLQREREAAARPRVPLSYYLTTEDQSYPDPPPSWANTQNFLVLGTDKRVGEPSWRTDVLMLVGLDRETGKVALFSIPRDLYVDIPGANPARVNTVDYLGETIMRVDGGGAMLVNQIIRKNFGISIQRWVRIEMDGLSEIVDALGGVTVTLDCPFFEPILNLDTNQWEYFTLPEGEVLMDGEAARWFVRLRLRESDIGRSRRQRQFIGALQEKALSTNALLRLPDLWTAMSNMYETDLGLLQTMNLTRIVLSMDSSSIRSGGLSGADGALENFRTEQGAQVLRIRDERAVQAALEAVWSGASVASATNPTNAACPPVPEGPPANPYSAPAVPEPDPNLEFDPSPTAEPDEEGDKPEDQG